MDSAAWGFIGSILGAVVGASTSIATSAINARHSLNLSIANKNFDRMERFNAFQRENLLAVQDLIQEIMRYMARIHMANREAHRNGRTWGRGLPNPEVEESLRLSNQKFSALVERISNDALRAGLKEIHSKITMVYLADSEDEAEFTFREISLAHENLMTQLGNTLRAYY